MNQSSLQLYNLYYMCSLRNRTMSSRIGSGVSGGRTLSLTTDLSVCKDPTLLKKPSTPDGKSIQTVPVVFR